MMKMLKLRILSNNKRGCLRKHSDRLLKWQKTLSKDGDRKVNKWLTRGIKTECWAHNLLNRKTSSRAIIWRARYLSRRVNSIRPTARQLKYPNTAVSSSRPSSGLMVLTILNGVRMSTRSILWRLSRRLCSRRMILVLWNPTATATATPTPTAITTTTLTAITGSAPPPPLSVPLCRPAQPWPLAQIQQAALTTATVTIATTALVPPPPWLPLILTPPSWRRCSSPVPRCPWRRASMFRELSLRSWWALLWLCKQIWIKAVGEELGIRLTSWKTAGAGDCYAWR